jgi:hypothetical protein
LIHVASTNIVASNHAPTISQFPDRRKYPNPSKNLHWMSHFPVGTFLNQLMLFSDFHSPNEILTWHSARPYQREVRRRTRVVRIFPNQASFLRLTTALAMEQSENWLTNHRCLNLQVSEEEPLAIH